MSTLAAGGDAGLSQSAQVEPDAMLTCMDSNEVDLIYQRIDRTERDLLDELGSVRADAKALHAELTGVLQQVQELADRVAGLEAAVATRE